MADGFGIIGDIAATGPSNQQSAPSSASTSAGFNADAVFGDFNVGAGAGADTSLLTLAAIAGIGVLAWMILKRR
jgi:hypothetical protein